MGVLDLVLEKFHDFGGCGLGSLGERWVVVVVVGVVGLVQEVAKGFQVHAGGKHGFSEFLKQGGHGGRFKEHGLDVDTL